MDESSPYTAGKEAMCCATRAEHLDNVDYAIFRRKDIVQGYWQLACSSWQATSPHPPWEYLCIVTHCPWCGTKLPI